MHTLPRLSSHTSFAPHALAGFVFAAVFATACGGPADETTAPTPPAEAAPRADTVSLDRVALEDPSRPEAERDQDADRRPIEVYEFLDVQPGQTVADVYNADGYNTHLLSRLVGEGGHVYSVFEFYGDKEAFGGQFYKVDAVSERITEAGLANVELAMRLADVPPDSVDVALSIRNYHDVEWVIPELKRADQLAELFRIVKPGGIVGIVEVATAHDGFDAVAHRLAKGVVIGDFIGAGFELVGESNILARSDDDYSVDGFPERHKTDRYLLKFQKPAH